MRHGSRRWVTGAVALMGSVAIGSGAPGPAAAQDFPVSSALPDQARQFDFWVGTWNVNLRVRQDDLSWSDQHRSVAEVYPILSGKAILELWSEDRADGIKGYSLRTFDTARNAWVLWLNWPGVNRSGSSSLSGTFRHGRGEFFSVSIGQDGVETISRYSFSDITDASLRWDDAFSTDGGETWTNRWIMEFTRTGAKPMLSLDGGPEHTYHSGARCDAPEFRAYEFLVGRNVGEVVAGGSGGVTITGHQILDGCAILTFAGPDADPERAWGFSHLTFNTYAQRYELTTLTSQPDTPVRVFYGRPEDPGADAAAGTLLLYEATDTDGPVDRFRIEREGEGSILWIHEAPSGDGWVPVWGGRVRRGPSPTPTAAPPAATPASRPASARRSRRR